MSSTAGRWFRYAAIAETISWAGLLIGMFFKYIVVKNDYIHHVVDIYHV